MHSRTAIAAGGGMMLLLLGASAWGQRTVQVTNDAELGRALREAQAGGGAGLRIVIAPGTYRGGIHAIGLRGTAEAPLVIEAADPEKKPLFLGGTTGLQFSGCTYLTLRNLAVRGQPGNGFNFDDGGEQRTPSHHITIEGLDIADIGPTGNCDGLKLSGIDDLVVRDCMLEGWGGQGIDMVGCHRVMIEGCTLRGKAGFSATAGVQAKGGSSEVTVRRCTFVNAGERAVNIGGSTGMAYFRPPEAKYEAKDVTVEGCRFAGSTAPVAFVGVDGALVRFNTMYQPGKWVVRILQETTAPGFVTCRNGRFERNLIVAKQVVLRTAANVGPNTAPESFVFRENFWFCDDRPEGSRPVLPAGEDGGVYGVDPGVVVNAAGVPGGPTREAARGYGAEGLR